ncbi:PREDICTED: putative pentatricopeptide repeat-containing protein At5g47460 [Nelumbo nucifera]|uniref:Pentatricopeptide repeat-containing protein At5g47460 n=2 Tax=Nelumbo nucifera TaxID=4432 RepID=A0A1U8AFC4_NELNU|nr:PREDICTED: putative pentatricopeptide repeat-containing protein At5g47460 [Nelumbo nucifera]DAD18488.1 TPA_asm: hypothetical protein HUJ06_019951 [Nelumbo nucifera]
MQRSLLKGTKKSLLRQPQQLHSFLSKNIIRNYAFGRSDGAKDVTPWTNLISVLARCSSSSEMALFEASRMRKLGIKPNSYTLVCMIRASTNLGWIFYGQQLHCYIIHSGFICNVFVSTAIISFYSKFELFDNAHNLFVEILHPNVVSWNSLVSGYVHGGQPHKALALVRELDRSDLRPDSFTFSASLVACVQLGLLKLGRSIHSKILKIGLEWNVVVGNCLIDMYGKCGSTDEAIQVFDETIDKDTVTWNSVVGATARNGRFEEALKLLLQMPAPDTISYNEVLNGIAQLGHIEDAVRFLEEMPSPSSSSWNCIISGYINRNRLPEALGLFAKMHLKDIEMDQFTYSSILRGIAGLSALTWGTLIHCRTIKTGLNTCSVVGSALIDMYSKCGQVDKAESIFGVLPRKNLVCWNAMISGYAHNGNANQVMRLFEQLVTASDLQPDGITFLSVLQACGQDEGLSHLGTHYLESMIREYGMDPMPEHCSCMIRLLGQRGEVWKAEWLIHELGYGSCGLVWRALLGACGACGDLKVAEVAAAKIIELEGDNELVYVLLSNMYASHGRWSDVSALRELMRKRGFRKEAGFSWIEVENVVSTLN